VPPFQRVRFNFSNLAKVQVSVRFRWAALLSQTLIDFASSAWEHRGTLSAFVPGRITPPTASPVTVIPADSAPFALRRALQRGTAFSSLSTVRYSLPSLPQIPQQPLRRHLKYLSSSFHCLKSGMKCSRISRAESFPASGSKLSQARITASGQLRQTHVSLRITVCEH